MRESKDSAIFFAIVRRMRIYLSRVTTMTGEQESRSPARESLSHSTNPGDYMSNTDNRWFMCICHKFAPEHILSPLGECVHRWSSFTAPFANGPLRIAPKKLACLVMHWICDSIVSINLFRRKFLAFTAVRSMKQSARLYTLVKHPYPGRIVWRTWKLFSRP